MPSRSCQYPSASDPIAPRAPTPRACGRAPVSGATRRAPLGTIVGARSGDKGGAANLGVWARDDRGWAWLVTTLTTGELQRLLPETATLDVTRHVLPNLRAVNFVIEGLLGDGVASNARPDAHAKALGEWLRSRTVDIPVELLNRSAPAATT